MLGVVGRVVGTVRGVETGVVGGVVSTVVGAVVATVVGAVVSTVVGGVVSTVVGGVVSSVVVGSSAHAVVAIATVKDSPTTAATSPAFTFCAVHLTPESVDGGPIAAANTPTQQSLSAYVSQGPVYRRACG